MESLEEGVDIPDLALLPARQKDVLEQICALTQANGYPPTLAELAKALGLRNRMTVHQHVAALKKKGFVHWEPGLNRSLKILSKAAQQEFSTVEHVSEDDSQAPQGIPLVGAIAAGSPIDAIEASDYLQIDAPYAQNGCYALKVKGESMIEDGIYDGDHVIVKPNPSPKNGDIVVALLDDGSATLKRFFKEKGGFRLQPANSTMKPIFVSSSNELEIRGVVVGLFRRL